jgi:SAM-dependent methyltransferase
MLSQPASVANGSNQSLTETRYPTCGYTSGPLTLALDWQDNNGECQDRAVLNQCSKPTGWLGRFTLWRMNSSHSKLTDWGLEHVSIANHDTILDVGCGGGRTVKKLAASATQGKVYGVDYSEEGVVFSKRTNARRIETGCVEIRQASVSQLPFADNTFDIITAVETHYFWPDLPTDLHEVLRVLKAGGTFILIAEVYKGANTTAAKLLEKYSGRIGMTLLTPEEHHGLLANAGYSNVQVIEEPANGWICVTARKPTSQLLTLSE